MALGRQFSDMLQDIDRLSRGYHTLKPSTVEISMLTITAKLKDRQQQSRVKFFELQTLVDSIDTNDSLALSDKRAFLNQLTIKHSSGVSVKLFLNGSLQLAGCKSVIQFVDVTEQIMRWVMEVSSGDYCIDDFAVQLINAQMHLNTAIPLAVLKAALMGLGRSATYDPDKYPGLNLKFDATSGKKVTVLCFKSGACIITGSQCPGDVVEGYDTVCSAMDAILLDPPPGYTSRKLPVPKVRAPATQPLQIIEGYDRADYMLTIS